MLIGSRMSKIVGVEVNSVVVFFLFTLFQFGFPITRVKFLTHARYS